MQAVDAMLHDSEGLVLVSGPTGSGKTTTVYSMLESISSSNRNIVSIEDPVEFPVPFVRQMSVDERHGIDMTTGLKTMLRMDPDVIFLGEIRDSTAADVAMQAAASGRYVFSTLHTRDVASVFTTLRDFGLANQSLAANISGIINQRLMRRLCTHCRREIPTTCELQRQWEVHHIKPPATQFERVGCRCCRGTGYYGRIGIFEAVRMSPTVRSAVGGGASEADLRTNLSEAGLVPLTTAALAKVAAGVTDAEEMDRVHRV
jgi:type II secretory ATPase GspE/PulE/Tfp pilus assembly ATPase PilB-like protein